MLMVEQLLNDPVSRIYAVISVLCLIAVAAMGYNYDGDKATNDLANKALLAAKTSRPFPYTSRMHAIDEVNLIQRFTLLLEQERTITAARRSSESLRLQKMITELPRPPAHVSDRLLAIERSLHLLEIEMVKLTAILAVRAKGKESSDAEKQ